MNLHLVKAEFTVFFSVMHCTWLGPLEVDHPRNQKTVSSTWNK